MRRGFAIAVISAALSIGTLTTSAAAGPLGPVNQANAAETGSDLLVKVGYGHRGYGRGWGGHRRGGFSFYLGAPAYYGYTRSNCWWSHRYQRRVCSY
jgi:hypothetical protein